MDPKLYVKLFDQRARQTVERASVEAEIAAAQPALDSAASWLSQCEASLSSAQSDLEAARAARAALEEGDDPTQADALIASCADLVETRQQTVNTARADHAALKSPQDERRARADALTAAINQCTDLMEESGLSLETEDIDESKKADARARVWERIKAKRDSVKASGVPLAGKWFHSDDGSRIQQLGLVMMGQSIPPGTQWKTMDGSFIEMTPTLAGQLFAATAARDMTVFAVAEQHRAALNLSNAPDAYDFSTGWPATYAG